MKDIKKVLIIRFSSIGDIVLTSPVIRAIKEQRPGVEIHYLTKKYYAPILENNPNVDKVYTIRNSLAEVMSELKAEKYDFIADLHRNVRSVKVKTQLSTASSTFDKLNFEKFLLVNLKVDSLPDMHIVDRYFSAVEDIGVQNDQEGLDYFLNEEDEIAMSAIPKSFKEKYIAWVIGAKHFTKRFPPHKIVEIIRKIDIPVVLLGDDHDASLAEQIQKEAEGEVISLAGKLTINQSAYVAKRAFKVATNDTGLMHIAAALRKPIISFWGNTIPEFGMYPYFGKAIQAETNSRMFQVTGLPCRPCSKIGFKKCPEGHFQCMREIDSNEVAEVLMKELD